MRQVANVEVLAGRLELLNDKVMSLAGLKSSMDELEKQFELKKIEAKALMKELKLQKHTTQGVTVKFVKKDISSVNLVEFKKHVSDDVFMECISPKMTEVKEAVPKALHSQFITVTDTREEFHVSLPKAKVQEADA